MRIAGTAFSVCAWTVVASRYQLDCRASAAKFGKRSASSRRFASISPAGLNSSSTSSTTGVLERTAAVRTATSSTKTSLDTEVVNRKSRRKTSGAGASTVRNVGTSRVRR